MICWVPIDLVEWEMCAKVQGAELELEWGCVQVYRGCELGRDCCQTDEGNPARPWHAHVYSPSWDCSGEPRWENSWHETEAGARAAALCLAKEAGLLGDEDAAAIHHPDTLTIPLQLEPPDR